MEVEMETTSGTWSEVKRGKEVSKEFGKDLFHAKLKKARSRRSRTGES